MSKTSHSKHEHANHGHVEATDEYGPTFGERHRTLILVIAVLFFLLAPLTFAIYWLLSII